MCLRTCFTSFFKHLLYWPISQLKKHHRLSRWPQIFEPHPKKSNALDWQSQPVHSPRFSFIRKLTQKNPWFIFDQRRPLCCPVQRPKTLPQWVVIKLFTSKKLDMTSSCNTAIFISSQGCVQPALKTTYSPGFLFADNEDEAMFRCLEVI